MSLYRCAVCGSPNVVKIEKNDGFSYSKALAGTVVFGTVGAVAGINGKKTYAYSCPDCGTTLPQPMDSVTKEKIDLVMTNPDALAPVLYPNIYNQYSYLYKQREKQRELESAQRIEKYASCPIDYSNPLNISADDFIKAQNVFKEAYLQLWNCFNTFFDESPSIKKARNEIKNMNVISEGLHSLRTIVYGIPIYSSLVDNTNCGSAFFLYVFMENGGEMTGNEFYTQVNNNPIYKQIYSALCGKRFRSAQQLAMSGLNLSEKEVWFRALTLLLRTVHSFTNSSCNVNWSGAYNLDTPVQLRFKFINESLYIVNPVSAEEQFEHDIPELANQISEAEKNIEQLKTNIAALNHSVPTQTETDAQTSINELQRSNSEINEQITKLHKKIFGKKKAAIEIQKLEEKKQTNQKQISDLNSVIEKARQQRATEIKEKKSPIEEQLSKANHALEKMKKQKSEYIQQYPEWICLAGQDAENQ